jgi:hypothetical protein
MYMVNYCNGQVTQRFRSPARAWNTYREYARTGCPVVLFDLSVPDGEDGEIAASGYGCTAVVPESSASHRFFKAFDDMA